MIAFNVPWPSKNANTKDPFFKFFATKFFSSSLFPFNFPLPSMKKFRDVVMIETLLEGSTLHEYTHAKISKENLAEAMRHLTTAVHELQEQSQKQEELTFSGQERARKLELANEAISVRNSKLEGDLETLQKGHWDLKELLEREKAEKERLAEELDATSRKLDDHENEIQRLLRLSDRQQATLQVLKLDISKCLELSGVGESKSMISFDQISCEKLRVEDGDKPIALSKILRDLVEKVDMAIGEQIPELEVEVAKRAGQEEFALVETKLTNTVGNLNLILRNFFEAGILGYHLRNGEGIESRIVAEPNTDVVNDEEKEFVENPLAAPHQQKLDRLRHAWTSKPIGPFAVTRTVFDVPDRFEKEIDTLSDLLGEVLEVLKIMKADLETKIDAKGVENKIDLKFDEVIDELDRAIASAGADEEEFKRAARELQEMCSLLAKSKADQSEIQDIRRKLEFDSKLQEKVEQLQEFVESKVDGNFARVARDELSQKLEVLHRKLREEMDIMIDERSGSKPWILTKPVSPEDFSKKAEPPICLACNRRINPSQMEMLKAPAKEGKLPPPSKRIQNTRLPIIIQERPKTVSSIGRTRVTKEKGNTNFAISLERENGIMTSGFDDEQAASEEEYDEDHERPAVIEQVKIQNFKFE